MNTFLEKEFSIKILNNKILDGYDNKNYHITTVENDFIYKTYVYSESLKDTVEAENDTLLYLQEEFDSYIPKPVPFLDNSFVKVIDLDTDKVISRMLSFLKGEFLGKAKHTPSLFESLGFFFG